MEIAALKLWELLGQKPRKSYLTPNVAEMVLIDVMSKYHGWIAGPWARLPQAAQWLPSPADSLQKGLYRPFLSAQNQVSGRPDPGQGPAHQRPRDSVEPGLRGPRSTRPLRKLASLSLRVTWNVLMSLVLQDAPGWRTGSFSVDHHTVSASRASCTEFQIIELQAKSWSIIVGVAFIIFLLTFCVQFSSLTINWLVLVAVDLGFASAIHTGNLRFPVSQIFQCMVWLSPCFSFRIDKSLFSLLCSLFQWIFPLLPG